MAMVYDPKTKRYVQQGSGGARPSKNYNFKLGVDEFNKKYLSYKYTPEEFKALSKAGYVGSFGNGVLGFKAPPYLVKGALKDLRNDRAPQPFTLPQNYFGSNIVDLVNTPNPTPAEIGAWYARAEDFDLAEYIQRYGHAPSEDSVYYQIYKPAEGIASGLEDMRDDALEVYQKDRDQSKRYQLLQLAKATSDPNISALANTLPIFGAFTAGERKRADEVLRDFGLTGLGATTIPFDIGSKYMLPVGDPSGTGKTTSTAESPERSVGEKAAIFGVTPILSALAQNTTIRNLVSNPTGPLAPTPADQVNPVSFVGNFIKGAARAGLGFPVGVAEMVANPIETTKSILKDYEYRYGSIWGNEDSQFIASTLEDPLAPVMDILGLVPIVGAGVKGAQIGKIAATTTRGTRGLASVDETAAVQRAINIIDEAERVGGPWAERGAGVLEARKTVTDAAETMARRAEEFKAEEAARVAAGGAPSRGGLSAREFARIQRAALNGDTRAELAMGELGSNGYMGINSGYAPTFVDRAAAFFEPRWTYFSQADLLPEDAPKIEVVTPEGETAAATAASETIEGLAPIRFAGSPLARGAQKVFFKSQKAIAAKGVAEGAPRGLQKAAGIIAELPLIGFNYRYSKALKTDVNSVGTLIQRELFTHKVFEQLIDVDGEHGLGAISSPEQLAIMSQVSGKLYSPQMLRSIMLRNIALDDANPGVMSTAQRELLEARLAEMDSPEFLDAYVTATREMMEGTSERGKRLASARDNFRRKMDLAHHEAGIELSDLDVDAQARIYAPVINALALEPETIATALNKFGGKRPAATRVAKLNPSKDLFELLDVFDLPATSAGVALRTRIMRGEFDDKEIFIPEEGVTRTLTRNELMREYDRMMEEFSKARDAMANEPTFRSQGNAPFIVVDSVDQNIFGSWVVRGRVIDIRGEYSDPLTAARSEILDGPVLSFPLEIFQASGKRGKGGMGKIEYYKTTKDKASGLYIPDDEFYGQLQRAAVNYAMKQFPDARDFTDKVGAENFKGREGFQQRRNENVVASSGFLDYHLKTQFAGHVSAVNRRFNRDIADTIENAAIPMTVANFAVARDQYVAVRSLKLHDSLDRAQNYAANYKLNGFSEPGVVTEVMVNGVKRYMTRMKFIDATKAAMKETKQKEVLRSEEWEKALFSAYDEIDVSDPDAIVMVVPKRLKTDLTQSYARSAALSSKIFSGATDLFKLAALSLNPRFVSQQVLGGAVMLMLAHPMQAGHIMARFMQYGYRNMARSTKRKFGRDIDDAMINHGDDYDIFMNKFIRDFEDNIYMQDAQESFLTRFGENAGRVQKSAVQALNIGYTVSFALEKNLRVAIMRESAMNFPGFKAFLDSPAVAVRAQQGMPDMGYPTISKFNAAVDLLSDRSSPYYNPMFLREIRHSADMVSGNYRDFTTVERAVRNYAIPFYAWTRHSAMFTKRLVQDRPLTANAVYNVGNYGYEQIFERGGMPDWLLESIPLPDWLENTLGLDPTKDNRVGLGSINPFGTMAKTITTVGDMALGGGMAGPNSAFEFTNPFINTFIEQQTGKSLLTGAPTGSANEGLLPGAAELVGGLPLGRIIQNSYKSQSQLNELRGREDPMAIFRDPNDPESKLRIPENKLNTKFPTFSPAGLWNTFAPASVYSVDPDQLGESISREFTARGMEYEKAEIDRRKGAWRTISALSKWKRTRDYVNNVWLPTFGAQDPALTSRVLAQMQAEFPDIPKTFPQSMVNDVLEGRLTIPEATQRVQVDVTRNATQAPRVEVVNPDPVELGRMGSHNPDAEYDRPAGTVNREKDVTVDSAGYVQVNGRVAVRPEGKRVRFLVDERGQLVLDERGLPIPVEDDERAMAAFWDAYNPAGSTGSDVPSDYYLEPWTISRDDWVDGGSITPLRRED